MTANVMAGDREKCLAAGMVDHVAKPIEAQDLYQTLARWAGRENAAPVEAEAEAAPVSSTSGAGDEQFPALDGIDVRSAIARLGVQLDFYIDVLRQFHEDFRDTAETVKGLAEAEEYENAQREAHSVKGAAGNIGATALQDMAAELESWYKNGNRGLTEPEFARFARELERVMGSLAGMRGGEKDN